MHKIISTIVSQFREFFKGLSPTKRHSIIAVAAIAGISMVVLALMLSQNDYAPLFSNVASDQVNMVASQLRKMNVPFKLASDGRTIEVPREMLHSTQMVLMTELGSEGVGTIGLELFDKQDFGTTSYAQKINYQRALQGELTRATVVTLGAVKRAKVLLALPTKKTFLEEGGVPTASVVVDLHPGKMLLADQIRGVQSLVASAVENLDWENVTILDARGKLLSRKNDPSMGVSSNLLEVKQKVEDQLEEKIESILSRVVGQERVIARVDVSLDNRQQVIREETVDPEKTAVRSIQTEEESLDGARTNPSGVPGSRANLPGAQDSGQVGFNQKVKKELKTTNYAVPTVTKNITEGAGGLNRVSVAVLVDGSYKTTEGENGEELQVWEPRGPEELKQYESLVKNAIGFDIKRGDVVSIESIQFQKEDFLEAEKMLTRLERRKLLYSIFKWGLLAFSLGLFFIIVVRPFMQWVTDSFQDSVDDMLPRTIEELEELQSVDSALPGMSRALPTLEEAIDPDKAECELLKDRISNLIENDPNKAANAFGLWLIRRDL